MSRSNRLSHGPLPALAVAALLLYAPLIGWGLPHATAPDRTKTYATDELLPLEALAEMQSTFIAAQPGRNCACEEQRNEFWQ